MRTREAMCSPCSDREVAPSLACWRDSRQTEEGQLHRERGAQGAQVHSKRDYGLEEAVGGQLEVLQPIWLVTAAYLTFSGWS